MNGVGEIGICVQKIDKEVHFIFDAGQHGCWSISNGLDGIEMSETGSTNFALLIKYDMRIDVTEFFLAIGGVSWVETWLGIDFIGPGRPGFHHSYCNRTKKGVVVV